MAMKPTQEKNGSQREIWQQTDRRINVVEVISGTRKNLVTENTIKHKRKQKAKFHLKPKWSI